MMKRRHLLAGAAALPFAGLVMPSSASDDPAVDAARRWLTAYEAERSYYHRDEDIPDDDPEAEALHEEQRRLWDEMLETPPTTTAGLALMLAAFLYDMEGQAAGSHFHDPDSWYSVGAEGNGTAYLLLPALWRSPAASELFRDIRLGPRRITSPSARGRPRLSTRHSLRRRSAHTRRRLVRFAALWSRLRPPASRSARMRRSRC